MSLVGEYARMARELSSSRELLRSMIERDVLARYKQSFLGIGWAILVPTVSMLVFTLVFTEIAPLETEIAYPIYAYAGLLPWTFFASSLRGATLSLAAQPNLVTKVAFPRAVLPVAATATAFVDFLAASSVLAVLMLLYGVSPAWTVLLVPLVVLVQVAFTLGLGLMLAAAHLFYRDVGYLVTTLLGLWMFATAVVYPVDGVSGALGAVLAWNPMTPIIEAYRRVLLYGLLPDVRFAVTAAVSLVLLAVGWWVFQRLEPRFAEVA